jgi:hypothetical protein
MDIKLEARIERQIEKITRRIVGARLKLPSPAR